MTLQEELNQFHGTESYYQHPLNRRFLHTDGVQHFATQAKAFWLIDAVAIGVHGNPGAVPSIVPDTDWFATVRLVAEDAKAILYIEDGNDLPHYQEEIEFTTCPDGEWKFFLAEAEENKVVMMVPSEY